MALDPGARFGPYEVTGRIGAGGMGEVYRATDSKLGRDVAIKTLPTALASDKDRLARFEREAKLLASLNHPHIASVFSLDEHEGTLYLAMELIEGETLEDKLKPGAIPVEDALRLALQIAEALEAAHDKGVIHRDLKPANIMVTADGVVKVLDFGLAKAFSEDPNEASAAQSPALSVAMTQQGLVLGTAGYMSPEQASGQSTDQRADIWAFGVVLYEMLTGLPLFSGESVPHILADVLKTEPDWSRLPDGLHPRLKLLLERCLTKKPRNRYHSIADARVDIQSVLSDPDGAIVQREPSSAGIPVAVSWQRKLLPWAAAFVVAVGAGLLGFKLKAPESPRVIRTSAFLDEGQRFERLGQGAIDISTDGRQFVYNVVDGVELRSMDSFGAQAIPGIDFGGSQPQFSPDGRSLALMTAAAENIAGITQLEFRRVPVTGGSPRPLGIVGVANGNANVPSGLRWEVDDTLLYAKGDGIWHISSNGGTPEKIVEVAADELPSQPQLLPGGEWVLFSLNRGQEPYDWDTAEIVAASIRTGERRVLYSGGSSPRYVPTGHLVFAFGSTLYALPFDAASVQVSGSPIPVVTGVYRGAGRGITQYAFSDNGTLIYVPGNGVDAGVESIGVFTRDGDFDGTPLPAGNYADPRVSPDGRRAAYTRTFPDGPDIEIYDLSGKAAPRRLTFGGQSRYPLWSADSTRVAFQSTRDGTASLYWQLADGSGGEPIRLTTAPDAEAHIPDSFSPDGQNLTFTIDTESEQSIWILDLAAGETEPLIAPAGARASQSVFSPDGNWIAYQSTETEGYDVFVQPFPLTGSKSQLPPTNTNHHPAWWADGKEIFYFPGQSRTLIIPVSTEAGFSFGTAQTLQVSCPCNEAPETRRQYDVMPDGSGVLSFVGGADGTGADTPNEIRIVYNWFTELEQLVPTR